MKNIIIQNSYLAFFKSMLLELSILTKRSRDVEAKSKSQKSGSQKSGSQKSKDHKKSRISFRVQIKRLYVMRPRLKLKDK